jgi:hypothetical protein
MQRILIVFLFLITACSDRDSPGKDCIRERQELEQKAASLNQVIKEMADEISNLQTEIDALNGVLANCEKAESDRPLPGPGEPQPKLQPAEADQQQRLLDYLDNREKRKK